MYHGFLQDQKSNVEKYSSVKNPFLCYKIEESRKICARAENIVRNDEKLNRRDSDSSIQDFLQNDDDFRSNDEDLIDVVEPKFGRNREQLLKWVFCCVALLFLIATPNLCNLIKFNPNKLHLSRNLTQFRTHSHPKTNCEISLSSNLTTIPLLSFPGSGNTWLRHLIEQASGIYTGSVYNDWRLYKNGFTGEYQDPLDQTTIVIKSHLGNPGNRNVSWVPADRLFGQNKNLSCIYLLRNPVDAYFSTMAFQTTKSHVGKYNYPDFHSMVVRRHWKLTILDWADYYFQTYTKLSDSCSKNNIKLVFYERLKLKPWSYTKRLVSWIIKKNQRKDLSRKIKLRKHCLKKYSEGDFHRRHLENEHVHNFPEDLFSEREKVKMDKMMKVLNGTFDGRIPSFYRFY